MSVATSADRVEVLGRALFLVLWGYGLLFQVGGDRRADIRVRHWVAAIDWWTIGCRCFTTFGTFLLFTSFIVGLNVATGHFSVFALDRWQKGRFLKLNTDLSLWLHFHFLIYLFLQLLHQDHPFVRWFLCGTNARVHVPVMLPVIRALSRLCRTGTPSRW